MEILYNELRRRLDSFQFRAFVSKQGNGFWVPLMDEFGPGERVRSSSRRQLVSSALASPQTSRICCE